MKRLLLAMALCLGLLYVLALPAVAQAPDASGPNAWSDAGGDIIPAGVTEQTGEPLPEQYRLLTLDRSIMGSTLAAAPVEGALQAAGDAPLLLSLPMPNGENQRFAVERSPVLEPALAARYPDIQTYRGRGIDDPYASVRLGLTPGGFHAAILANSGTVFITSYPGTPAAGGSLYMSYFAASMAPPADFFCGVHEGMRRTTSAEEALRAELGSLAPALAAGSELRSYRLALAATGEFAEDAAARAGLVNPTAAQLRSAALDALVARVNLVNVIYEREASIHFNLVASNDVLIYVDPATDPYTDTSEGMGTMLGQNQQVMDGVIGSGGYDIGHVLGTAGGGVAYLGVTCNPIYKAGGVSGSGAGVSAYTTMVTAHEIGHQFDADHTFNANSGACGGGNRSARSAYEPGSGSTIMSYAGLCGAGQNLPGYNTIFHVVSFDQMIAYSRSGDGAACATVSATTNRPPSVDAGPDYTIPARTPFVLSGAASDPDGDPLQYSWQQVDVGAIPFGGTATLDEAMTDWGSGPLYRVYPFATGGATRFLPALTHVLAGTTALGEVFPTKTRTLNFRLFARDDRSAGGGANYDAVRLNVLDTGAAFAITQPDGASIWPGGLDRSVTWNIAGTTEAPIACTAVDILFSADNGATFTTLAQSTPNDGAQAVALPATATATARIQVRCADNIFYTLSPPFAVAAPSSWGAVAGRVHDEAGAAISGANVTASGLETVTTVSGPSGEYTLQLLTGDYTLSAAAYGYTATTSAIAIGDSVTTTRDFMLPARPLRTISGTVRDAGHGYPLYATLAFTDAALNAQAARVWSDPRTGSYSVTLYAGIAYSVGVSAWLPGYATVQQALAAGALATRATDLAGATADFMLSPAAGCAAPGYTLAGSQCIAAVGGLLIGNTFGPNAAPLAGVRIAGGGRTMISTVTADPLVPGAFYSLFLPPGSQSITATGDYSNAALPPLRATVLISTGAVTQQDLNWQPIYIDASLSSLTLNNRQLMPPFAPGVLTYTLAVAGNLNSITVLPVTNVTGAAVRVNGMTVISGVPSPPINLAVGDNQISIGVTALDGASMLTYRVIVTRAQLVEYPVYLPDIRNGR
jgi:hypothetical protein